MLGTASIKVRPLKLALLVDPNSASQVREAIRLACGLWGGMFFPIIPMHRRLPATWRQMPVRSPSTVDVLKGYLDGFDPDILVQFCTTVPDWVRELNLRVLKPAEVVGARFKASREPAFGIGVSELLDAIYKEHFKYKAKYPMRVVVPEIPSKFGLFWASVFGEYDASTAAGFTQELLQALEVERPKVASSDYLDLTGPNVLFPRRITAWDLNRRIGPRGGSHAYVFYMDASSVEDIIDFWNLQSLRRTLSARQPPSVTVTLTDSRHRASPDTCTLAVVGGNLIEPPCPFPELGRTLRRPRSPGCHLRVQLQTQLPMAVLLRVQCALQPLYLRF